MPKHSKILLVESLSSVVIKFGDLELLTLLSEAGD
jgi:hypothetical protein